LDNISGLDAYSMYKYMASIWARSLSEFQSSGVFVFGRVFKSPLVNQIRTIGEQSTELRPALRGYWLAWIYLSEPEVFLFFRYRNWEEKSRSATFTTLLCLANGRGVVKNEAEAPQYYKLGSE
jgi:hypothetical protein